jgi:hypothetical protein
MKRAKEFRAEELDPAHLADVLESLAQAKRGEFASDAQVEAAFRRFAPQRPLGGGRTSRKTGVTSTPCWACR